MTEQAKGKPGPKKGWTEELKAARDRVNAFNNSSYLERVLRVLFGGKV